MKKKHALILILVLVLVFVAGLLVWHHLAHPIRLDAETLPGAIEAFYRGDHDVEVELYDSTTIGRSTYYLFEMKSSSKTYLGYATLEKGLFGRYKLSSINRGSGNYQSSVVESQGKQFLLVGGRNPDAQIARISVAHDGTVSDLTVPSADHFLLYTEVATDWDHLLSFYNAAGEDITGSYVKDSDSTSTSW